MASALSQPFYPKQWQCQMRYEIRHSWVRRSAGRVPRVFASPGYQPGTWLASNKGCGLRMGWRRLKTEDSPRGATARKRLRRSSWVVQLLGCSRLFFFLIKSTKNSIYNVRYHCVLWSKRALGFPFPPLHHLHAPRSPVPPFSLSSSFIPCVLFLLIPYPSPVFALLWSLFYLKYSVLKLKYYYIIFSFLPVTHSMYTHLISPQIQDLFV